MKQQDLDVVENYVWKKSKRPKQKKLEAYMWGFSNVDMLPCSVAMSQRHGDTVAVCTY
mgnify:CR=1 FL=1